MKGYRNISDMYIYLKTKIRPIGMRVKAHNVFFDKSKLKNNVEFYDKKTNSKLIMDIYRFEPVDSLEGIIVGSVEKFDTINRVIKLRGVFVY